MTVTTTRDSVTRWFADFGRYGERETELLDQYAAAAATDLQALDGAGAQLVVGNGTEYVIALHRLPAGIAKRAGGSHLIALPGFGRCAALDLAGGYWTPDYIEVRFGLRPGDAIIVSAFLTLLGARLP